MPQSRFTIIHVSEQAYDLIADLEAAWCRFTNADAKQDLQEVGNAYADLCQRRKELHQYIESLEFNALIPRTITLRFD